MMKYIFREELNNIIYCVVPDNYVLRESDTLIGFEQFMSMTVDFKILDIGISSLSGEYSTL